jgi:hypothetical protein
VHGHRARMQFGYPEYLMEPKGTIATRRRGSNLVSSRTEFVLQFMGQSHSHGAVRNCNPSWTFGVRGDRESSYQCCRVRHGVEGYRKLQGRKCIGLILIN